MIFLGMLDSGDQCSQLGNELKWHGVWGSGPHSGGHMGPGREQNVSLVTNEDCIKNPQTSLCLGSGAGLKFPPPKEICFRGIQKCEIS